MDAIDMKLQLKELNEYVEHLEGEMKWLRKVQKSKYRVASEQEFNEECAGLQYEYQAVIQEICEIEEKLDDMCITVTNN